MSTPARRYDAVVTDRRPLSDHLVRLVLGGSGLSGPDGFASTGVPDEWVGLTVPGQFQSRYYTVRSWDAGQGPDGGELVLDVVVHDVGLVTEWAMSDCVGQTCTLTEAKGSFAMPADAQWLLLVGDLTALPAMARVLESTRVPARVWAEVPGDRAEQAQLADYLPTHDASGAQVDVTWLTQPGDGLSELASAVETIDWPSGDGYFWMAGESAQMRAVRKHLMRDRAMPTAAYDVMGYWRGGLARQPRAVDRRVSARG